MPFTSQQLKEVFGAFTYRENPKQKGAIIPDPRWRMINIVSIPNPLKPGGKIYCHKKIAYQLERALKEGVAAGHIKTIDGCYVPRHILWDPNKPLSGHAYGCDVDVNANLGKDGPGGKANYGVNSYQNPELINIFKKWGFEWGGSWRSSKDGMHFSCVKIIAPGAAKQAPKPPTYSTYRLVITPRGKLENFKSQVEKRIVEKTNLDHVMLKVEDNLLTIIAQEKYVDAIEEAVKYYRGTLVKERI